MRGGIRPRAPAKLCDGTKTNSPTRTPRLARRVLVVLGAQPIAAHPRYSKRHSEENRNTVSGGRPFEMDSYPC
jgi:hypothetical protein